MYLKALDTIHISSVRADNIHMGDVFEINDHDGQHLIHYGLAAQVAGKPAEPAPSPAQAHDSVEAAGATVKTRPPHRAKAA